MKKDYQFLIGQRFTADGETYVVRELVSQEDQVFVLAAVSSADDEDIVVSEAGHEEAVRTFRLNEVIQSLLVDEEIELFSPNYLAALDRAV